ncbi:unnamed protein product [Trichobilharzia szidati]|nr:unnamed protein product [Trichobilharzia szidati]
MYRFSQLVDSSELREQFVDLTLKSESQTVEDDKCSRSATTKSKKGKHRNTSKDLRESGKSCNSGSVLKDSGDVTKIDDYCHHHLYLEPCGFRNVRNSCFLNASLQLLLNIPPLCTAVNKYTNVSINNDDDDGVSDTNDNKKTPLINQL